MFNNYKVTPEFILQHLDRKDSVAISLAMIESISEFKKGTKAIFNLASAILEIHGHSPIMEYRFSMETVEEWCVENNLKSFFDEGNRVVYFYNL